MKTGSLMIQATNLRLWALSTENQYKSKQKSRIVKYISFTLDKAADI